MADCKEFRTPCDKTIPSTRPLRVLGEGDLGSCGMGHDVSWMAGEEYSFDRTWMAIMRPRWQRGHSRNDWPVSLSYRSR